MAFLHSVLFAGCVLAFIIHAALCTISLIEGDGGLALFTFFMALWSAVFAFVNAGLAAHYSGRLCD